MSTTETKEKPPIGLKPRWMAESDRAQEIVNAITRYNDAKKEVPRDWLEELEEVNKWLEDHGYDAYTVSEAR